MTAQRTAAGDLVIRDRSGDSLSLYATPKDDPDENGYLAFVDVPGFPGVVGLTFDDGLALLQALAVALKVERYEPASDPAEQCAHPGTRAEHNDRVFMHLWRGSSAAYGEALEALDRAQNAIDDAPGVADWPSLLAQVGTGRAILALVDEVEPLVELLRVLVEQHRVVDPGDVGIVVDGPRIRSRVLDAFVDRARLDGDVPFVEDPNPFAHDHGDPTSLPCPQCAVPGGTCCPHCSGARIGSARGSVGGRT